MQSPELSDLFRAISHELGQPDVEALEREGYLVVDGVAIGLSPGSVAEAIDMVVDLGEVGDEGRAEIFEEVLCINLELQGPEQGRIGLEDETDHLVLTRTVSTGSPPDAQFAAETLRRYAEFSNAFKDRMRAAVATGSFAPTDVNVAAMRI